MERIETPYKLSPEDSLQLTEIALESKHLKIKHKKGELKLNEAEWKVLLDFLSKARYKTHDWKIYLDEITVTQKYSGLDFERLVFIQQDPGRKNN